MHYRQNSLYVTKVHMPDLYGLPKQTCQRNLLQYVPSSPETLDSPSGCVVLLGHSLLWSHPSLSFPPSGLFSSSIRSLPDGLVGARYERFPNLLSVSLFPCHLTYPRNNDCMHATVASTITLAFLNSAKSRLAHSHDSRFVHEKRNEAAKFALCYGLETCSPYTDKGFYD